jgi:hypothetical protein
MAGVPVTVPGTAGIVEAKAALGPPACANAKVPDRANAEANAIVVSFMGQLLSKEDRTTKVESNAAVTRMHHSPHNSIWDFSSLNVDQAVVYCPKGH